MSSFINLHCHFDYSVLDGGMSVKNGVSAAVELGQTAIAITDHGTLGGTYALHKAATAAGIKPILGIEAYYAPDSRTNHSPVHWGTDDQRADDVSGGGKYLHLTLLARNAEGLRNLYRLNALGYSDGFYGKPRIDLGSIAAHADGLTILTGCPGGVVQTAMRLGQPERAERHLADLRDIAPGNVYVELMDHGIEVESRVRSALLSLAKKLATPVVATGDAHYARPADREAHDTLLCVQTKAKKSDVVRFRFDGTGYHLPSYDEMEPLFRGVDGALSNTLVIADSVEGYGDFFERSVRMPASGEDPGFDLDCAAAEGLSRLLARVTPEYWTRLGYELDVINGHGYTGYFLTLMEIINEWRSNGIRVGPGRGSAGGSLVSYALGITEIDPIRYGLVFERFLNPERISLPDIDTDIQRSQRPLALRIARERFGHTRVVQIGQYGTIGSKNALKDSARVLSYPYEVGTKLVSLLPAAKFGREPSLAELPSSASPKDVVVSARGIEGLIRSTGIHPAAVIISPHDVLGELPIKIPGGKAEGLVTELTGEEIDELGYVKFDWLGLENLDVIDESLRLLRGSEQSTSGVSSAELPTTFDDPEVYDLLSRGDTAGVFQLDGYGMRTLLKSLRPRSFSDIAAVLALYRPGPMAANAHNEFAKRATGKSPVVYPHPEFESSLADTLSPTYGLIVFQEQVLDALRICGGYTYGTAGTIFDSMRKKNTEKMLSAKPEFERRLRENGYGAEATRALWETLVPFSDYSFNKAHCVGYGMVAYWTAWLKVNHPKEFYCAILTKEQDSTDPPAERAQTIRGHIHTAVSGGVPVLPPDINESGYGWRVVGDGIRFGIGAIKGISQKTYAALDQARPYSSMEDFFARVEPKFLNVGVLTAAIKSGLFDTLEPGREQLLVNAEALAARALADREMAKKGHRRLWTGYTVQAGPRRLGDRQTWETEVLGTALTRRAIHLKLRRNMDESEWVFLKSVMDQYSGIQPVNIVLGELTTLKGVANIELSPKAVKALKALGTLEIQEDQ